MSYRRGFTVFIVMVSLFYGAEASVFKGQRAYMKLCKKCHKSGGKLAGSHTQSEWDEFFEKDAKLLKDVHRNDPSAMKKLNTKKFQKNLKHMRQFFNKYASDSGNVPACN